MKNLLRVLNRLLVLGLISAWVLPQPVTSAALPAAGVPAMRMDMRMAPRAPQAPAAGNQGVSIANFSFSPATLSVAVGTTVTWTNQDMTMHTVTADDASFDSGPLDPGGTFSFTFTRPGTYAYHCAIHPDMVAKVMVNANIYLIPVMK